MSDDLQLGLGIQFDSTTLKQLDQILTYVKQIQKKFESMGDPLNSPRGPKQAFIDVNAELNKINLQSAKVTKSIENINKHGKTITQNFQQANGHVVQITRNVDGTVSKFKIINKTTDGMASSIGNAAQKMLLWASSATMVYGTLRGLQAAFRTMISLETEAMNIKKVLPEGVSVRPFEERSIELAKRYGQSVLDVEKATADWAKQYKTVGEVAITTQASLLAATATDISFEGSVKSLSAIIAEWNLEAKDSIHIVDMLNIVSNNYRVTAEGVAEALAKSGSGAKALGMTMEQLTGIVTTGIQVLGMEGNTIGTFWTRTMARLRGNDSAVAAIKDLGIDAMQPLSTLLDEVAAKWDLMTSGEKQNFAITVAGTQHWSRFTGIMDNYNTVIEATAKSYDSMDSAQKEVDRVMQTTQKHIQQLVASWQEYIYRNSGVLNITKNIVDMFRTIVSGLSSVPPSVTLASIAIIGLTAVIVTLRNASLAAAAANTTLMATMLSNPITWVIGGLTVLATILGVVGANAIKTQNEILKMQTELAKFDQYNEGMINKSRGIIDLSSKYEIFSKAIEKAKASGQDYSKLTNKFNVAQNELAKAVGVSNVELEMMIKKDGGIKSFMENRLKENAALINSEREKANAIASATKAKLEDQLKPQQALLANLQQDYQKYLYQLESASYDGNMYKQVQARNNAERTKRNIEEVTLRMQPNLNAINEIKIDPKITKVEDFYNEGTGSGGFGDDPTEKIKTIFSTLTESEVRMISKVSNALNDLLGKNKFEIDTQQVFTNGKLTNPITTNMPNEISDKIMSEFNSISQATEQFTKKQIEIEKEKQKALETGSSTPMEAESKAKADLNKAGEDYSKKLQEDYDDLVKMTSGLDMASDAMIPFANYLKYLKSQMKIDAPIAKYDEKQLKMINSTFDTLTSALSNMGNVAADTAAVITNAFSQNFGADGLNTDGFKSGVGSGIFQMLIDGWIKGMNKPEPQLIKTYQVEQYDVTGAKKQRQLQDDRQDKINKYIKKIKDHPMIKDKYWDDLSETPGIIDEWHAKYLNKIKALQNAIKESIDNWAKAVGVGINDITQAVEDAFQASNAMDFLQNWGDSLESMVRSALIRGFMAQEAFQGLYRGLSQTIAMAVIDGQLSAQELLDIRTQGNVLGNQLSGLYQALNALDLAMPGGNSSGSEQNYTAGMSQSISISNFVNIYGTYFGEDPDGLREFALLVAREISREQSRA